MRSARRHLMPESSTAIEHVVAALGRRPTRGRRPSPSGRTGSAASSNELRARVAEAGALVVVAVVLGRQHPGRRARRPRRSASARSRAEGRRHRATGDTGWGGSTAARGREQRRHDHPTRGSTRRENEPLRALRSPHEYPPVSLRVRTRGPYRSRQASCHNASMTPRRLPRGRCRALARAPPCVGTDHGNGAPIRRARTPRRRRAPCPRRRSWPARARRPRRRRGRAPSSSRIERDRVGLAEQLLHREQRREPGGDAGDERLGAGLGPLDLLPVGDDLVGAARRARRRTRADGGARACRGCAARRRRR